jgi:hypothetical protein
MNKNPVLDVLLTDVMRPEIALPLQQVLGLYTVGNFLRAWRDPRNQRSMQQLFESPEQARHAAATCAAWLGVRGSITFSAIPQWWAGDSIQAVRAGCR